MHNPATLAGIAAPEQLEELLPSYSLSADWLDSPACELEISACAAHGNVPGLVWIDTTGDSGPVRVHYSMTPAQARHLAVYLVDCANALDNPADRVIVDTPPSEGFHQCDAPHCSCAAGTCVAEALNRADCNA